MTVVKLDSRRAGVVRLPRPPVAESKSPYICVMERGMQQISMKEQPKRRVIEGIASTGRIVRDRSVAPMGAIVKLPAPLLFGHGFKSGTRERLSKDYSRLQIGEIFLVRKTPESVVVRANVWFTPAGNHAWEVIEGWGVEERCFSIGAVYSRASMSGVVDGAAFFREWEMQELSITNDPANPDCHFQIISD